MLRNHFGDINSYSHTGPSSAKSVKKKGLPPLPSQNLKVSLARALSKMGYCSRNQARSLVLSGRVRVNGEVQSDAETRVDLKRDRFEVDDQPVSFSAKIYLMLNKPRGTVTTRSDEKGRKTVYEGFKDEAFPWLSPVGRLDKASEGLLLFTNDTRWAARIETPETYLPKTYHVQVDCVADRELLMRMTGGIFTEKGYFLRAKRADLLRQGRRNTWLEVVLDEGKNRHIRRLLSVLGVHVIRLIRVSIGPLKLGSLPKGAYRHLTAEETRSLTQPTMKLQKRSLLFHGAWTKEAGHN